MCRDYARFITATIQGKVVANCIANNDGQKKNAEQALHFLCGIDSMPCALLMIRARQLSSTTK